METFPTLVNVCTFPLIKLLKYLHTYNKTVTANKYSIPKYGIHAFNYVIVNLCKLHENTCMQMPERFKGAIRLKA